MPAWLVTVDLDLSRSGSQHTGDHLEQRALAGTVRPNDGHPLTGVQVERNFIQNNACLVAHADFDGFQDGFAAFMVYAMPGKGGLADFFKQLHTVSFTGLCNLQSCAFRHYLSASTMVLTL